MSNRSQLLSRYNQSAYISWSSNPALCKLWELLPPPLDGQLEGSGCGRMAPHHPPALAFVGARGGGPPIISDCLPAALASRDANPQAARGLAGTAAPGSGGFGCAGWAAPPGGGSGSSARPPSRHAPLLATTGSPRTWPWGTAGSWCTRSYN